MRFLAKTPLPFSFVSLTSQKSLGIKNILVNLPHVAKEISTLHLTTCYTTCYISDMLKTYLYLPEELDNEIRQVAKTKKKSKAEVLREAISSGIKTMKQESNSGLEVFRKLAEIGKKYNVTGPKDSAANHDHYLWDKDWSKDE